jgi:hypothetical protein
VTSLAGDTINFKIAHLRLKEFLPIIMAQADSRQRTLKIPYSASRMKFLLREDIANEKSLHFIQSFHKEAGKHQ